MSYTKTITDVPIIDGYWTPNMDNYDEMYQLAQVRQDESWHFGNAGYYARFTVDGLEEIMQPSHDGTNVIFTHEIPDDQNFIDLVFASQSYGGERVDLTGFDQKMTLKLSNSDFVKIFTGASGSELFLDVDATITLGSGQDIIHLETWHWAEINNFEFGNDVFVYQGVELDFESIDTSLRSVGTDYPAYEINGLDNFMHGTDTDDVMTALDETDALFAGLGNDRVYGSTSDDILLAGGGDDYVNGGDGNDTILGGSGNDTIKGGIGHDVIYGGDGDDRIYGGKGSDIIHGGDGNDFIHGTKQKATIYGDAGNDIIYTSQHSTTADGGTGDDKFYISGGKAVHHIITGGEGADSFIFSAPSSRKKAETTITDFNPLEDSLIIEGIDVDIYNTSDFETTIDGEDMIIFYGDNDSILIEQAGWVIFE